MNRLYGVLPLLLCIACSMPRATGLQSTAHVAGQPRPVQVVMIVQVHSRSGPSVPMSVEQGQRLRSGDRLSVLVKADEPAYVYLFFVDAQRKAQPLYASKDDQPLTTSEWVRVPPLPDMVQLDQKVGEENLLLIAQRRPLALEAVRMRVQQELDNGILTCAKGPRCLPQAPTRSASDKEKVEIRNASGGLEQSPKVAVNHPGPKNQPQPEPFGPDQKFVPMGMGVSPPAEVRLTEDPNLAVLRFRFLHAK